MIPNLEQLLLVCGISLAGVGLIVWLILKIPVEPETDDEDNDEDERIN
ncbi:hypothetical protein GPUN_2473 [Glaciecola punicea ACAM 611]|jgi:hypothetical protein|uniref:Uncharacterized protein n=1 Tax=Glaciecola punicea ACAM 611 TaxID=1121923 RepID=H5TE61_9ALTE|nr:hypothetical protein [Glaciecola punicea]GAB56588.1 hypothetical protein GPUN_2473 [Glaciecola punicea ACAM 611]